MELGLTLVADATDKTAAEALGGMVRLCEAAEARGIKTLWFTEHHHNPTRASSALPVLMGAVGARTTLRLGAATLLPGLHDAVRTAEAMGTLEALYPGRMLWGFGKGGGSEIANTHLGTMSPEGARNAMLHSLETLTELRGDDVMMPPLSVQTPWFVATRNPAALAYAARNGLGIMFGHKWPIAELVGIISAYRSAHPEGKAPEVMLSRHFLCEEDTELAQERVRVAFESRRTRMRRLGRASGEPEEIAFEESLIGTPEACRERMERFRAMGVTHLTLRPAVSDDGVTVASLARLLPMR